MRCTNTGTTTPPAGSNNHPHPQLWIFRPFRRGPPALLLVARTTRTTVVVLLLLFFFLAVVVREEEAEGFSTTRLLAPSRQTRTRPLTSPPCPRLLLLHAEAVRGWTTSVNNVHGDYSGISTGGEKGSKIKGTAAAAKRNNKTTEQQPRKKTKKAAAKRKDNKKDTEPMHWIRESDEIVWQSAVGWMDNSALSTTTTPGGDEADDDVPPSLVQFTVRGNPLPLRRHRTSRGFVYNPSAAAQKSFRETVESIVFARVNGGINQTSAATATTRSTSTGEGDDDDDDDDDGKENRPYSPLWKSNHTLAVSILFCMKRPKNHFVSGRPGPGRLRATAPSQSCSRMRTDVDNLAKFVLDALNGVLYEDDRQIASLHVTKLYDNDADELCRGSTRVCLRLLREDDLPRLLSSSFDLY